MITTINTKKDKFSFKITKIHRAQTTVGGEDTFLGGGADGATALTEESCTMMISGSTLGAPSIAGLDVHSLICSC